MNATDSLIARWNGSAASATARQGEFQLLLLLKLLCSTSHDHKQTGMLNLLLG